MKKAIAATFAAGILSSSSLFAASLTIVQAPNSSATGGEFILTLSSGISFRSFCIEKGEHVGNGGTYSYVENNAAVLGGLGGPSPDPISIGTAWLYSQFRAGTLVGAMNAAYDTSSSADQTDLQDAFWWLEQEIGTTDRTGHAEDPYNPNTNQYLQSALAALGSSSLADLQADAALGLYGVEVYNLSNLDGSPAQDQLALIPDGGSTLVLLGLAFTGFALMPKRRKK